MRRLLTTFGLAISSLVEHPMRSLLTSLGVIIGVGAVFAMLAIGEGTTRQLMEQANSVSTRTMTVYQDWGRRSGRSSQARPRKPFIESDVEEFRNIPGVVAASGEVSRNVSAVSETADWNSTLTGIDTDYLNANDLTVQRGRAINFVDLDQRATVALIGQTIARTLYRDQDPIGQRIKVNNIPFEIIGVVNPSDQQNWRGQDPDDFILAPLTTARNRVTGGNQYVSSHVDSIKVVGGPDANLQRIQAEMDVILKRSRAINATETPDYRIFNFAANIAARGKTERTGTLLLAAMGIVSLIVGGVGVMNIMLVSVTERTREIGLRMAIGAKKSDILTQFLTEAVLLCLFGGLAGLALGYSVALLPFWGDISLVYTLQTALIAFGSAMFIGVVFGFLPARRAAQLNPIEALRHE